jgi:hypothetical protein
LRVDPVAYHLKSRKERKDDHKSLFRPAPTMKADKKQAYLCQWRGNTSYWAKATFAAAVFEEKREGGVLET